jgi:hypothetical protein
MAVGRLSRVSAESRRRTERCSRFNNSRSNHTQPKTALVFVLLASFDWASDCGKLPLSFETNRGQTDGWVCALARAPGCTLFVTSGEAVFQSARSVSPVGPNQGLSVVAEYVRQPGQKSEYLTWAYSGKSHLFLGGRVLAAQSGYVSGTVCAIALWKRGQSDHIIGNLFRQIAPHSE